MGAGIVLFEAPHPLKKLLCPPLFEHPHQRASQRFGGIAGDFGDGGLRAFTLLHERAGNLFKFDVARDVGADEDVGEFSIAHQQLGDQVDVPIVRPAVLLPRLGAGLVIAVLLEQSLQIHRSRLATIMVIPVHVKHLLALDGHDTAEDTFRQACAEDDDVVFGCNLLHGEVAALSTESARDWELFCVQCRSARACRCCWRSRLDFGGGASVVKRGEILISCDYDYLI